MTVSFKLLNKENINELMKEVSEKLPEANSEDIQAVFDELEESISDSCEYAVSVSSGCLLLRIYDGEYLFPYPIALEDGANPKIALDDIRKYAVKEEIPLVICDLPREVLSSVISLFRHCSIDAADFEGEYYTLRPISELTLVDDIPTEKMDGLELSLLRKDDESDYARLCRDQDTNRYWGYDFREDVPDCEDSYFLEAAESETNRGVAVSFAVRSRGEFAGEAILYGFDLRGGAQCAIRILPEHRRKHLATDALELLSSIASQIGLLYLYATVDGDNDASLYLFHRTFHGSSIEGRNTVFHKIL